MEYPCLATKSRFRCSYRWEFVAHLGYKRYFKIFLCALTNLYTEQQIIDIISSVTIQVDGIHHHKQLLPVCQPLNHEVTRITDVRHLNKLMPICKPMMQRSKHCYG